MWTKRGSNKGSQTTANIKTPPKHATMRPKQLLSLIGVVSYITSFAHLSYFSIKQQATTSIDMMNSTNVMHPTSPYKGKERLLKILKDAGIDEIDEDKLQQLPTWETVRSLYGDGPRIYGLDQCQVYQQKVPLTVQRFLGVAGMFNSGTHFLYFLMRNNCYIPISKKIDRPKKVGMLWQVPWGKHNLPTNETFRLRHKAEKMQGYNADLFMTAVILRDPYHWMQSMCRHPYSLKWKHTSSHCPNLIPNSNDLAKFPTLKPNESVPTMIRYTKTRQEPHESLLHTWNDFYDFYYRNATFPRIMVRMEDLIFYAEETVRKLCSCVGGRMNETRGFQHVAESAKAKHNSSTGLLDAMILHGNSTNRFNGLTRDDLEFADKSMNRDLMNAFRYSDIVPNHDSRR